MEIKAIDGAKVRAAIEASEFTASQMATLCGKTSNYFTWACKNNKVNGDVLEKLCIVTKTRPEDFCLVEEEPEAKEQPKAENQTAELKAEITAINDAMASMVRMLETVQNTVKRISDEVSTLKDVEYTAAQESKRFYQAGNSMFKTIAYWLKGNNREV